MPSAFDTVAPDYARHRAAQAYVVERLGDLHARAGGGTVLEVGCGTGEYAAAMAGGARVFGLDPSRGMLRHADGGRLQRVQGEAHALPFARGAFRLVFSVNVIHHVEAVTDFYAECHRVLAPGGIVCTATDSGEIIRRRDPLSRYWPETVPVELERYHPVETLDAAMRSTGFRACEARTGRSTFPIPDSGPYRDRIFSCLRLIPEDAFRRGLAAMEADLRAGPLAGVSELLFLVAERP